MNNPIINSDYIISINRSNDFTFYKRCLRFLFPFWFKKPITTIHLHKNRRGN